MQAFREGPLTNTSFLKQYTYQHKMASLKLQWPLTNRFWKRNNIKIGVSLATSRMPNQISLVCECVDSAWQSTTSVCDARSFQIERERPLKYSSYLLSSNCCIPCERPSFLLSSLPRFQFCVPDVSIYPCQKLCSQTKKNRPIQKHLRPLTMQRKDALDILSPKAAKKDTTNYSTHVQSTSCTSLQRNTSVLQIGINTELRVHKICSSLKNIFCFVSFSKYFFIMSDKCW